MVHFSHTFYTIFLSSIIDLRVGVLTCLQTPFVPLQRLIVGVPDVGNFQNNGITLEPKVVTLHEESFIYIGAFGK